MAAPALDVSVGLVITGIAAPVPPAKNKFYAEYYRGPDSPEADSAYSHALVTSNLLQTLRSLGTPMVKVGPTLPWKNSVDVDPLG